VVAKLPFGLAWHSAVALDYPEFLVVNGWILTRDDVAAMELTADAVRLQ
jgi:hypothetical protein